MNVHTPGPAELARREAEAPPPHPKPRESWLRTHLRPRSLLGQMILLIGAVLLVTQLANLALILNEHQKLDLAQNEGPAVTGFTETARRLAATRARGGDWNALLAAAPEYSLSTRSLVEETGLPRSGRLETRLRDSMLQAGLQVGAVRAATLVEARPPPARPPRGDGMVTREQKVALLSAQLGNGVWLNGRIDVARSDFWLVNRLILGTILLYAIVLAAAAWVAIRLGRPLRDLAHAAEQFREGEPGTPIVPRGPTDIRRAIRAFNGMNARVAALLDQKDRMLGAIGHDLRTPLSAIRIRAENMGPEEDRTQLFATVDEMAEMLEDILVLARTGRPREAIQRVDLNALADTLVEEFRLLGREVELMPSPRVVREVQPILLRRALRNLIENGCTHADHVRVTVAPDADGGATFLVEDDGPGIPPAQLEAVLEPFIRLDPARRRHGGGAGLGLTIAAAVAQAHGGRLELENRAEGGLRARLVLPGPES